MKVLIDTCIWSNALRYKYPDENTKKRLSDLIYDGRAMLIGPIRQEILSGISKKEQFNKIKETLKYFEDIDLSSYHYEKAAEFCNICRKKGIQGSNIDFLICSAAYIENLRIFTKDNDFLNYEKHIPIKLFK